MWSTCYSTETIARPEAIWDLWSHVQNWTEWDLEIHSCHIEGDFKEGTRGRLKPKGGPETKFILTGVEPMKGFSDRSFLPFATIDFFHRMEVRNEKVWIEHRVEMKGPLTFIFKRIIGTKIVKGLPVAVQRLTHLAEKSRPSE